MVTEFQKAILRRCCRVPKGRVTTYKEIAKAMKTKAYRAVGTALKNNRTPLIIPCHRVINSDGSLGGYKGKKNNKEKLRILKKEGIVINNNKVDLKKYLFKL